MQLLILIHNSKCNYEKKFYYYTFTYIERLTQLFTVIIKVFESLGLNFHYDLTIDIIFDSNISYERTEIRLCVQYLQRLITIGLFSKNKIKT